MTRDGDGMTVEVVKGDALGKETVERHTDVRSVELPSTRGMVRLDDVVDLLLEDDDVPRYAVERVKREIDDDPSTGGHIAINSPSSSSHTALFERVEIYAAKVDNARGSATCGPDETWLHVVIPDELDARMFDAVNHDATVEYNRSGLVEQAVDEYLDDTPRLDDERFDRLDSWALDEEDGRAETLDRLLNVHGDGHVGEATDAALIDELQSRGYDVLESYDHVLAELREFVQQSGRPVAHEIGYLEDLIDHVDAFELAHVEALEEAGLVTGDAAAGVDIEVLFEHVTDNTDGAAVRRAFEQYHRLPVEDGGDDGGE